MPQAPTTLVAANALERSASGSFGGGVGPWLLLSAGLKFVGHIQPHAHHETTWLFMLPLVVVALKLTLKVYRWQKRRRVSLTAYTRALRASQWRSTKLRTFRRR